MSLHATSSIWRRAVLALQRSTNGPELRCHYSTNISKPLRILFCGSDEFSCASLQAVYETHKQRPDRITSIDVMCRPGKPSGRGMKQLREVPIKALASTLGLPIHERDTFTGWSIPPRDNEAINLIIAVSFGLLIPPRILNSVEYGGINLHPSLLPDLRGPAPLHHAILQNHSEAGVTIQNLHPTKFDHGKILLQKTFTPKADCTYKDLLAEATNHGAALLKESLLRETYLPTFQPAPSLLTEGYEMKHAPKITTADKRLDFRQFDVEYMIRQERALERPWTNIKPASGNEKEKRAVFHGLGISNPDGESAENPGVMIGPGIKARPLVDGKVLLTRDDGHQFAQTNGLLVTEVTIDGEKRKPAASALFDDDGRPRFNIVS